MECNKIYYKHGAMFSGKSLRLISLYDSYVYKKKNVMVAKPSKDTRDIGVIKSRMSDKQIECHLFDENESLVDLVSWYEGIYGIPDIILIDEIQFATLQQIEDINTLSAKYKVMCYGLKTTYTAELFPAISKLLTIAEDVEEIKSECFMCDSKATHNLLIRNGKPVYTGNFVNIEGDKNGKEEKCIEEYKAVCRYHYHNPIL